MDCHRTRDLLPSHAAGALPASDAAAVAGHLAACPTCRDAADAWHAVARAMDRRAERLAIELPAYRPLPAEVARLTVVAGGTPAAARPPAGMRRAVASVAIAAAAAGLAFVGARVLDPKPVATLPAPGSAGEGAAGVPAAPTIVLRAAAPGRRVAGAGGHGDARGDAEQRDLGDERDHEDHRDQQDQRNVGDAGEAGDRAGGTAVAAPPTWTGDPDASGSHVPDGLAVAPTDLPTAAPSEAPPTAPATDPVPATATNVPPLPPTASAPPVIAGIVYGGDGQTLPGARVLAAPADGTGGAAAEVVAVTDDGGAFALAVTAGRWLVHVEAAGHAVMWRSGKPSPLDADAVDVDAGGGGSIDFHLEPAALGVIRGRVVDADGRGVARALVLASPPDRENGGVGRPAAAAFTDADGGYALPVPPGGWLVAATRDGRGAAPSWWGGDGSLAMADAVAVDVAAGADGIDVRLSE